MAKKAIRAGTPRRRSGAGKAAERPSPATVRASGVLLHPTSLPGAWGTGDLGPGAHAFVDWLASARQRWWQMLPVVAPGYGDSPYSARSAFAGSPLLISPEALVAEGWVAPDALGAQPRSEQGPADFQLAARVREALLRVAFAFVSRQPSRSRVRRALADFEAAHAGWLDDWALFEVLKARSGGRAWTEWERAWRDRHPDALQAVRREAADELALHRFTQWVFHRQWARLRVRCRDAGVQLLGDVPIFVAHDSADVWVHREVFHLDAKGQPSVVAGVPPDYFSATGQRWGNPLYRWRVMRRDGYRWWMQRLASALERFDAVRLDHFIGFHNAWQIPASSPTATTGRWVRGPGADFFVTARKRLGGLPFVAEDLGVVTPQVAALRDAFDLPGLRVLQFAFGDDPAAPTFVPHVYPRRVVACTGTHDNDTVVGWFSDPGGAERTPAQVEKERAACLAYLGTSGREIHWEMIREVMKSVAALAVTPMQDVLGLGSQARMNRPGTLAGNWCWRLPPGAPDATHAARLGEMTVVYGRT